MMRPAALALALALALAAPAAEASPLVAELTLPTAAQRSLAADIRAARAARPDVFARVRDLVGLRPAVYRATRAMRPSAARELRAMGPAALMPMLDVLAVSGYGRALSDDERDTLVLGALDAVGSLRDRRAEPVLRAAFERMRSPDAVRAAARALGALAGDGEVALLTAAARAPGMRQAAALEGLGVSRRTDAALAIADVLDGATDAAVVTGAARGLAEAGSTWAQHAAHRDAPLPRRCVEALLRAFVRGAADHEVMVAVAVSATYDTLLLLDAARADADAAARPRLEALSRIVRRGLAR